jgi:hypothetical protein
VPKGVIVLLVVVAVVFVITLVIGGSKHNDGFSAGDSPPGYIDSIGIRGKSLTMDLDGLGTSCGVNSATRITISGSCNITVPSRSAFSRPLNVILRPAGSTITVRTTQAGKTLEDATVPGSGSQCYSSGIDHKGAELDLFCISGPQCIVDLLQESCS